MEEFFVVGVYFLGRCVGLESKRCRCGGESAGDASVVEVEEEGLYAKLVDGSEEDGFEGVVLDVDIL